MHPFFDPVAKDKVKVAVKAVEALSSAEIVVAVRDRSDTYRDVDYLVGFVAATLALTVATFHPAELDEDLFPVEVIVAFALAALVSSQVWTVKSRLVHAARRRAAVEAGAASQFYRGKISNTRGRTGILVYVSAFERMVALLPDVGVPDALEAKLADTRRSLEAALDRGDVDGFARQLEALGPGLAEALPRAEDDVNELPDEVA
ncbi:MAG TPA: hypothetical protein PLR99_07865 [Polyangiaceae bacterium]|nr:hypothetical protein [Polyangiaceae bacterium]